MDLINTEEFASMVRTSPSTVRYWRHVGKGPRSFTLGRRVLYDRKDVVAWIESARDEQDGDTAA